MKAISLHIALNELDWKKHYKGSKFGRLSACVRDAEFMACIAAKQGFNERVPGEARNFVLRDSEATVENVKRHIKNCAAVLGKNDIFLLTYSGHGSQIKTPLTTEPDEYDETWCLYDREFFDDEILELFSCFEEGVRIFFISDSCHSGTIATARFLEPRLDKLIDAEFNLINFEKMILIDLGADFLEYNEEERLVGKRNLDILMENDFTLSVLEKLKFDLGNELFYSPKVKSLLAVLQDSVYERHKPAYDNYLCEVKKRLQTRLGIGDDFSKLVKASVIQISACQDNETTGDGHMNKFSDFTEDLKSVWDDARYPQSNNYYNFYADIIRKSSSQTPGWDLIGNNDKYNYLFKNQFPFTTTSPF